MIIKRLMAVFICLQIAFFPNLVFASTVGGWNLTNPVSHGASTLYNGTRQAIIDGKNFVKTGSVLIKPAASNVSKVLVRGVAGYALSIAVEQLLGAVDWVLDPANSVIIYKKKQQTVTCYDSNTQQCASYEYFWQYAGEKYSSPDCLFVLGKSDWWGDTVQNNVSSSYVTCTGTTSSQLLASFTRVANPNYDSTQEQDDGKKTLPLDVVSAQVISNAESETDQDKKVAAQTATQAAAADIVQEAENDATKARPIVNELEQSATTTNADADVQAKSTEATGTQTQNPAKPEETDLKLDFPVFCGWAPTVCEAAQVIITKPQVWADAVSTAWADFWNEPDLQKKDDTVKVEEKQPDSPSKYDADYVNFGGSCPTFSTNTITVGFISIPLSFDLTPLCDWAKLVRPAVLGVAYLSALAIISTAIKDA